MSDRQAALQIVMERILLLVRSAELELYPRPEFAAAFATLAANGGPISQVADFTQV